MPFVSLSSSSVAIIKQCPKIGWIKLFVLRVGEIWFDIGEVVVYAIALGGRINAEDVIVATVMDHRGDRSLDDR